VLKRILIAVVVVLVVFVIGREVLRARGASARADAARELYVPVIVSPSVQPVNGQAVLVKATNITEYPVDFRLMLFNDREGLPTEVKDFPKVPAGTTVTYLYNPPMGTLAMNDTTVEVPEAVRAVFAPLPAGDQNVIRRIVANVQLMRLSAPAAGASAPSLDSPIVVPLERCRFEPRGFVPYTGGKWMWNCAPELSPYQEEARP
jgi:hypothetical protein